MLEFVLRPCGYGTRLVRAGKTISSFLLGRASSPMQTHNKFKPSVKLPLFIYWPATRTTQRLVNDQKGATRLVTHRRRRRCETPQKRSEPLVHPYM